MKIGLIDSGIDYNHEQFQHLGKKLKGVNLVAKESAAGTDNFIDTYGHGTQVAGILCGKEIGIVPKAELYVAKVSDNPKVDGSPDFIEAVVNALEYCKTEGCDIVNLSLGTIRRRQALEHSCQEMYRKGIIIVASSGNRLVGPNYPASFSDCVISEGSLNKNRHYDGTCNVWPKKEIVAPGREIFTSELNNKYLLTSGSSFAVPHITGILSLALAMLRERNIPVNPEKVRYVLCKTADTSICEIAQAQGFIATHDPEREIFIAPQKLVGYMFGAGLVQANNLFEELLKGYKI